MHLSFDRIGGKGANRGNGLLPEYLVCRNNSPGPPGGEGGMGGMGGGYGDGMDME
jgi:hypothetical protein